MPRPRKCRRVCELPRHTEFGPRSAAGERLAMAVDEYECIRLIDLEGLRMGVVILLNGAAYSACAACVARNASTAE